MGFNDEAEDLNDPAVKAKLEAFVKNRHYPVDTYRVQNGCSNCRHVFVRQEHEGNDELYCTFGAPPRPPCMSILMGESEQAVGQPWSVDAEGWRKWNEWKALRRVVAQGICGEWSPNLSEQDADHE